MTDSASSRAANEKEPALQQRYMIRPDVRAEGCVWKCPVKGCSYGAWSVGLLITHLSERRRGGHGLHLGAALQIDTRPCTCDEEHRVHV